MSKEQEKQNMKHKKEKADKSITVGELFELAECPLTLPESSNANKKRKRRKEKPIVIKLAPGHENWQPDPKVNMDIIMDAIERRAEAMYEVAKGNLKSETGRKYTLDEVKMALICEFERKLKERLN